MGILDKAKHAFGGGVDKAADAADKQTGGKHRADIDKAAEKAKDTLDRDRKTDDNR